MFWNAYFICWDKNKKNAPFHYFRTSIFIGWHGWTTKKPKKSALVAIIQKNIFRCSKKSPKIPKIPKNEQLKMKTNKTLKTPGCSFHVKEAKNKKKSSLNMWKISILEYDNELSYIKRTIYIKNEYDLLWKTWLNWAVGL